MELNRLSFLNGPHVHVCIFFSRKRQVYVWKGLQWKMFGILGHFQGEPRQWRSHMVLKGTIASSFFFS
ncbi:hypothetical protein NC652_018846 [Populus alba x Populus x berolinensis]|nr:hypothetical protein NC652_018841 [Populus alba x Populus x berolinensis]KAJ6916272.1 hypothetical protein NC652_018846 [Populus alba x Populus x berolinensis]